METTNITNIDCAAQAPKVCPHCGGRITYERLEHDADTGYTGCLSWSCGPCDEYWIAPLTEWSRSDEDR